MRKTMARRGWRALAGLIAGTLLAGCAAADAARRRTMLHEIARAEQAREAAADAVSFGETLTREAVVRAVLAQNPDLDAAYAAWRAAVERQPSESALADPQVEYAFAPLSIGSQNVDYGQVVTVRQAFPFPGRLSLRSAVANAEAAAAREDVESVRLELASMAAQLHDRLVVLERAVAITAEHRRLVDDLRQTALDQLTAGRASPDAPLRAELDGRRLDLALLRLASEARTVRARLNGLLHRDPAEPLPAAVATEPTAALPSPSVLQAQALTARPELRAADHRVGAREAARELRDNERLPDFGLMASYNSMWRQVEHQLMVGLAIRVPLQLDAHAAAVRVEEARTAEARARRDGLSDRIRVEVEEAHAQAQLARDAMTVIAERLLPTARDRLEAARAAYVTGRAPLSAVLDAERDLRDLALERVLAEAEVRSADVRLLRAVGRVPGLERLDDGGAR